MATQNSIGNRTYTLTSDTGITATTGNLTATAGNLVSTLGDLVVTNGKMNIGGSTGTDGQIIVAATGANATWASVSAGSGITVTPGVNTLSIASTVVPGLSWSQVGADGALVVNTGIVNSKAGLLTMSLPAASAINTIVKIVGWGAGGWIITQAANQQILFGNTNTTLGAGGSLASSDKGDTVALICVIADLVWRVMEGPVGNLTVV